MRTAPLAVVLAALLVVQTGAATPTDTPDADGIAEVVVDDLVIGEDELRFGPMRSAGYPDGADEVVVELDLAALRDLGVDTSDAAVDVRDEAIEGASLESATVENGVVRLVFEPEDTGFAVREFRLTGLDTSGAEAAAGVELAASFSGGEANVRSFDVVDPDAVSPTLSTGPFSLDSAEHRLTVEDVQPADAETTVEVDASDLASHGIGVDRLAVEADADGGTVREATAADGVATVVVEPADGAVLIDVTLVLSGFDAGDVDTDERVYAEDVVYEVRVDGEHVDVEPFDVLARTPTPVHAADTGGPGEDSAAGVDEESAPAQSLGVVVPVLGIAIAAWRLARRDP